MALCCSHAPQAPAAEGRPVLGWICHAGCDGCQSSTVDVAPHHLWSWPFSLLERGGRRPLGADLFVARCGSRSSGPMANGIGRGRLLIDNVPQMEADQQRRTMEYNQYRARDAQYDSKSAALMSELRSSRREAERLSAADLLAGLKNRRPKFDELTRLMKEQSQRMRNFWDSRPPAATPSVGFSLPHGWAVGRVAVPPAWWLIGMIAAYRRRRRLRLEGCCQQCGYDLRATPEQCPECGLVPCTV
jgi:hypothetical protein